MLSLAGMEVLVQVQADKDYLQQYLFLQWLFLHLSFKSLIITDVMLLQQR